MNKDNYLEDTARNLLGWVIIKAGFDRPSKESNQILQPDVIAAVKAILEDVKTYPECY